MLRGKELRIRFANQGALVKVKNISSNVSNELLKEAFEQYFGPVERAVIFVDDRGKSIGEGIVEFERKPSAQKCLNDCTERCFFLTR
jgi:proline- and glutamine-rich splicing factor